MYVRYAGDLEDAKERQRMYGGVKRQRASTRERTYRDTHNFRILEKVRERIKVPTKYYNKQYSAKTYIPFAHNEEAMQRHSHG